MTPDISTTSLRQEKWWADWRGVDFSWEGLAKHLIDGLDPSSTGQTLQDYWRTDPETLSPLTDEQLLAARDLERDPSGRLWHIAHIPAEWDDGSGTWKTNPDHENWRHFWQLTKKRVFSVPRRELLPVDEAEPRNVEVRFGGVVFGRAPDDWEWHSVFDSFKIGFATCAFLEDADFAVVNSRIGLSLRYCLFRGRADFDGMVIEGDVDFSDSTFLSEFSMCKAEIRGNLEVSRIHCFGEFAVLGNSLHGKTTIHSAVFYGPNGFEATAFGGEVSVSYCRFLSLVSLASTTFKKDVTFLNCLFSSEDITFTGECEGDFYLIGCAIEHGNFVYMHFRKAAYFSATRFRQSTTFQNANFHEKVSFRNSIFESDVSFQDVVFHGPMEFHNTVFVGVADLSQCSFPADARFFQSGFRGAEFRRVADFTNPAFFAWGAFSGTKFHQPVLFSPNVLRSDASFNRALEAAGSAVAQIASDGVNGRSLNAKSDSDQRFGELESAFQTLKVAMAGQQARLEEQRFYRFELLARRRQTTTPFFERIFSFLYDWTSVYGTSLALPLIWLAFATLVFAFVYWAMTRTTADLLTALWPFPLRSIDPGFVNALTFSVRNVFQPFSAWTSPTSDGGADRWAKAFLDAGDPLRHLVTRLLATLQSLISPALLFLSALAIKRRFQIT